MTPAQRWGAALDQSMTARGVTPTVLASRIHMSRESVREWTRGEAFPMYKTALKVADAMGHGYLADLARTLRTRTCEECGRSFVGVNKGVTPRWCTKRCQNRRWDIRKHARRAEEVRTRNGRELAVFRRAVEAFCQICEPDGLCRMADCELRGVSPLRLADERVRIT